MQTIFAFALNAAIKAGMFNQNNSLTSLIEDMDEDVQRRFIEAVIGCNDPNHMREIMPKKSKADTSVVCTYRSYNYLKDRVEYNYQRTDEKWFKTPEEAKEYTETGKYDWNAYKCNKTDDYTFQAFWTYPSSSYCSYSRWMENAVEEEA